MKLDIDEEKLVERLADLLVQHEERLLSEVVRRIDENRPAASESVAGARESNPEIMGIRLHALYPVTFLADRWDVTEDNVRKKPESELPRSDWNGGEIRYRGIDILRYEGVDVEKHMSESPARLENELAPELPEFWRSNERPARPDKGSGDERPYNGDLPALSDEESSPY
jgi:hypothetical protein